MKTLHLMVNTDDLEGPVSEASLAQAAAIIRSGGTVAFPTETVYGLGANALDEAAVAQIFEAKQRPSWDPLIVHVSDLIMMASVASDIPEPAQRLMKAFWPGPLTLLVPRSPELPAIVTAGRPRIGVRIPAHPIAMQLIKRAGLPIAAPSANTFGRPSPTSAAHVLEDLDGRIDAVLDGGETQHGLESTVVDTCESPVLVYRPGVISLQQIAAILGGARAFREELPNDPAESAGSPGLGWRHYAPRARLVLIEGEGETQRATLLHAVGEARRNGEHPGLMLPLEFDQRAATRLEPRSSLIFRWGSFANPAELAQRLFAGLRHLDAAGATMIICPIPPEDGLGIAIRDRLRRAAR